MHLYYVRRSTTVIGENKTPHLAPLKWWTFCNCFLRIEEQLQDYILLEKSAFVRCNRTKFGQSSIICVALLNFVRTEILLKFSAQCSKYSFTNPLQTHVIELNCAIQVLANFLHTKCPCVQRRAVRRIILRNHRIQRIN